MSLILSFGLMSIAPSPAFAQGVLSLPAPGSVVNLSSGFVPVMLRGLKVYPDNPFKFDFIIDSGNTGLVGDALKEESQKLAKYFLATLTTPEKELWVNLSPYENDRIIPEDLGETAMGQDLLAQDYILKQVTASLILPDSETGKAFWDKVYKKTYETYGTTNIPTDTFNKVWIVPEKATVYEDRDTAFITESRLKVMLEEDYTVPNENQKKVKTISFNTLTSSVAREILIPLLEKEVNEGENFTQLRQMFNAMVLATWYKQALKTSLLNKVYADKNKTAGIKPPSEKNNIEAIYDQYLAAYKKGVCDLVKVEQDPYTHKSVARKYFSGGFGRSGGNPISSAITRKPFAALTSGLSKFIVGTAFAVAMILGGPSSASAQKSAGSTSAANIMGTEEVRVNSLAAEKDFLKLYKYRKTEKDEAFIFIKQYKDSAWAENQVKTIFQDKYDLAIKYGYNFLDMSEKWPWLEQSIQKAMKEEPRATVGHGPDYLSMLKTWPWLEQSIQSAMKEDPWATVEHGLSYLSMLKTWPWLTQFIQDAMKEEPRVTVTHGYRYFSMLKTWPWLEQLIQSAMKEKPIETVAHGHHYLPMLKKWPWLAQFLRDAMKEEHWAVVAHGHHYLSMFKAWPWLEPFLQDAMKKVWSGMAVAYGHYYLPMLKTWPWLEPFLQDAIKSDPGTTAEYGDRYLLMAEKYPWLEQSIQNAMREEPKITVTHGHRYLLMIEKYPWLKQSIQNAMKADPGTAVIYGHHYLSMAKEHPWLEQPIQNAMREEHWAVVAYGYEYLPMAEKYFWLAPFIQIAMKQYPWATVEYGNDYLFMAEEYPWIEQLIQSAMKEEPWATVELGYRYLPVVKEHPWLEQFIQDAMKKTPELALNEYHFLRDLATKDQWLEWIKGYRESAMDNHIRLKDLMSKEQWDAFFEPYPFEAFKVGYEPYANLTESELQQKSIEVAGRHFLDFLKFPKNQENVKKAADLLKELRNDVQDTIIFGPGIQVINLANEEDRFDLGEMEALEKSAGVRPEDIVSLKGGKKAVIDSLIAQIKRAPPGPLRIYYLGHGEKKFLGIDNFAILEYTKLADALLERGDINNVMFLNFSCFSFNFNEFLVRYLQSKAGSFPQAVFSQADKDRLGYGGGSGLLPSLKRHYEPGKPLLIKHFIAAEDINVFQQQNPSAFYSFDQDFLKKLIQKYFPEIDINSLSFPYMPPISDDLQIARPNSTDRVVLDRAEVAGSLAIHPNGFGLGETFYWMPQADSSGNGGAAASSASSTISAGIKESRLAKVKSLKEVIAGQKPLFAIEIDEEYAQEYKIPESKKEVVRLMKRMILGGRSATEEIQQALKAQDMMANVDNILKVKPTQESARLIIDLSALVAQEGSEDEFMQTLEKLAEMNPFTMFYINTNRIPLAEQAFQDLQKKGFPNIVRANVSTEITKNLVQHGGFGVVISELDVKDHPYATLTLSINRNRLLKVDPLWNLARWRSANEHSDNNQHNYLMNQVEGGTPIFIASENRFFADNGDFNLDKESLAVRSFKEKVIQRPSLKFPEPGKNISRRQEQRVEKYASQYQARENIITGTFMMIVDLEGKKHITDLIHQAAEDNYRVAKDLPRYAFGFVNDLRARQLITNEAFYDRAIDNARQGNEGALGFLVFMDRMYYWPRNETEEIPRVVREKVRTFLKGMDVVLYRDRVRERNVFWGLNHLSDLGNSEAQNILAADQTASSSLQASNQVGGIDFNSSNLELKRTGSSSIQFSLSPEWQGVDLEALPGFVPVIINIVPIADLMGILGLSSDESAAEQGILSKENLIAQQDLVALKD